MNKYKFTGDLTFEKATLFILATNEEEAIKKAISGNDIDIDSYSLEKASVDFAVFKLSSITKVEKTQ